VPLWGFVLLTLFPFYWMLITSLKPDSELYNIAMNPLLLREPTFKHYRLLFEDTPFVRWMVNTMVVAVVSTGISLVCAIGAGYALARLRFCGATVIGLIIFTTYLIPHTLIFLPLAHVVHMLGLANSLWALILTYPTFLIPFCTWLLMGYFKTIPLELEECAMIDGASRVRAMWSIVLPLARPGLLSAGIFAFTLSWNEFIYALVFLSSPETKTIPIGVVSELIKGDVFYWGSLMAGALLGSVPVAIFYSFLVEHYVGGLTAGAVKG
jgi:multiple sugar transport system permease protein